MEDARTIIARVEKHTRQEIKPRRLRLHIISTLQREIDKRHKLEGNIRAVLNGADTFDPSTHKAIRLPRNA